MSKRSVAIAAGLLIGLVAATAQAAGPLHFDVSFSFYIKDKEMPPGRYEITPRGETMSNLAIRNASGGEMMLMPVTTRLANFDLKEAQVVFDVAGGKYYLSEVHFPGSDGFELPGAPGAHTHAKVTATE